MHSSRMSPALTALAMAWLIGACADPGPAAGEGQACKVDMDCAFSLQCVGGLCRLKNCPDRDCPVNAYCIEGQCCDSQRCCTAGEGPTGDPSCDNGVDDDCDGLTDAEEADCYSECEADLDCDDDDPCSLDACFEHLCEHQPIQDCCLPTGTFEPTATYAIGQDSAFVRSADVDGDGALDLLLALEQTDQLGVLPGLGDGTFGDLLVFPAGLGPIGTAVADLNADGLPDVVVSNPSAGQISVLRNTSPGPGTIALAAPVGYVVGQGPYGLAISDLDGDGDRDLAVALRADNRVALVVGDGDGNFAASTSVPTGLGPHGLAAADLDGDGDTDLLTADYSGGTVSVLINQGGGSFSAPASTQTGLGAREVVVADLTGDDVPDVLVANSDAASLTLLPGEGDGGLAEGADLQAVAAGAPRVVTVADLDADGDQDIGCANNGGDSISVFLNQADGTFAPRQDYPAGTGPLGLTVGDFNLDGLLDLAASHAASGDVYVYLGQQDCND